MTNPIPTSPLPPRNTRALLIRQQRLTRDELPLPRLLQSPYVVMMWALVLSTVVAALVLGRIRVPRIAQGVVVSAGLTTDSLTPVLLLPPSVRRFVKPGQLAAIDTGGSEAMSLAIASVEPALRDTVALVAQLERCSRGHCLPLSAKTRYAATAALGTRSLASFALPRS